MNQSEAPKSKSLAIGIDLLVCLSVGGALTWWFWRALVFTSAGFLGGDIYNYYFPLRKLYADGLATGGVYLWHPGIGNGVPVLGESQTGAFYLPYLTAYRFLSLADAYNAIFLGHYILAFAGSFFLGRKLGLARLASLLLAMIFVFGWFPERACLEWAIVTGSWCPIVVALSLAVLEGSSVSVGWALAAAVAMQLLAGHFQLAFVTIVGSTVLGFSKLLFRPNWQTGKRLLSMLAFLGLGFALAAPQLVPAWMLKARSQRQEDVFAKSVDFGNVPLWYWNQMVFPDEVYPHSEDLIRRHGSTTNLVEAQLYPGRVTLVLLALLPILAVTYRRHLAMHWRDLLPWLLLLVVGGVLVEGSVFRVLSRMPGFGYFRYPGRYGMLVLLPAAVLAGKSWQAVFLNRERGQFGRLIGGTLGMLVIGLSGLDFYCVRCIRGENQIGYATIVDEAPIRLLDRSAIKTFLLPKDRVLAVDGNTLSLLGPACVPPYLGLGPAEYYDVWGKFPNIFRGEVGPKPEVLATLYKMGVTHALTEKPLPDTWPVRLVFSGYDAFLHTRWGRDPREPLYLYELTNSPGRFHGVGPDGLPASILGGASLTVTPHRVEAIVPVSVVNSVHAYVLTDLGYPGWYVTRDDFNSETLPFQASGIFRKVDLRDSNHIATWHYLDIGMLVGCCVAFIAALALPVSIWLHRRYWIRP